MVWSPSTPFKEMSDALRLEPALDRFALIARPFLDLSNQLFHAALGLRQIVVGHLSPFAFDLAGQLLELALHLIAIQLRSSFAMDSVLRTRCRAYKQGEQV